MLIGKIQWVIPTSRSLINQTLRVIWVICPKFTKSVWIKLPIQHKHIKPACSCLALAGRRWQWTCNFWRDGTCVSKMLESGNLSSTNVNHNGSGTRNPAIQQRKSQHVIAGYISNIDKSQLAGILWEPDGWASGCTAFHLDDDRILVSESWNGKKQTVAVQSSDFSFNTKYLCLNFHCLVLDVIFHTIHMFVASNHVCVAKNRMFACLNPHIVVVSSPPKKTNFVFLKWVLYGSKLVTPRIRWLIKLILNIPKSSKICGLIGLTI